MLTSVVTFGENFKLVKLDGVPAEYSRKEFVVGDVLEFSCHDAPTVLEQLLVIPMRIDLS